MGNLGFEPLPETYVDTGEEVGGGRHWPSRKIPDLYDEKTRPPGFIEDKAKKNLKVEETMRTNSIKLFNLYRARRDMSLLELDETIVRLDVSCEGCESVERTVVGLCADCYVFARVESGDRPYLSED
ncbi:hypothetical protein CMI41_02790 [Candidatus Pacearchaeota archaeon]|nr:hypothetical protein [Candidatus Pacearchaeota archaeon]|tara:strand:+ start:1249 stop:1629 length:381 start_codon:yes stop_codon:yes gene_type:complete